MTTSCELDQQQSVRTTERIYRERSRQALKYGAVHQVQETIINAHAWPAGEPGCRACEVAVDQPASNGTSIPPSILFGGRILRVVTDTWWQQRRWMSTRQVTAVAYDTQHNVLFHDLMKHIVTAAGGNARKSCPHMGPIACLAFENMDDETYRRLTVDDRLLRVMSLWSATKISFQIA